MFDWEGYSWILSAAASTTEVIERDKAARAALRQGLGRKETILLIRRTFNLSLIAAREIVNRVQLETNTVEDYTYATLFGRGRQPHPAHLAPEPPMVN